MTAAVRPDQGHLHSAPQRANIERTCRTCHAVSVTTSLVDPCPRCGKAFPRQLELGLDRLRR